MLVYHKKTDENQIPADAIGSDLPISLQEHVANDNIKFEEWCKEMVVMRDANIATGKAKHEEMRNMYMAIQLKPGRFL